MPRRRCRRPVRTDRSPLPDWADEKARKEGEHAKAYAEQEMGRFDAQPALVRAVGRAAGNLHVAVGLIRAGAKSCSIKYTLSCP